MKRRQFLRGVLPATVVLSGCQIGYSGPANPSPEPSSTTSESSSTPTRTSRPTPDGYWRTVSLEGQDTVADRHQATLTATVEQRWITADQTALLPVTLTNDSPRTRTFYNFDRIDLEQGWFDGFNDNGALIGWTTQPPECIGTDGKEPGPFGDSGAVWLKELRPDESFTKVFGIVDDPRRKGCISPGTYRFNWEIEYNNSGASVEDIPTIRWGITLRVRGSE